MAEMNDSLTLIPAMSGSSEEIFVHDLEKVSLT